MEKKLLLSKINETLDQLIENTLILSEIKTKPDYRLEVSALEKTQESLLAKLIHLDNYRKQTSDLNDDFTFKDKMSILTGLSTSSGNGRSRKMLKRSLKNYIL
tara:strand:+ start:244 stop:552 length:309 start_codon:yes stop_codon:yes gene_type:complete